MMLLSYFRDPFIIFSGGMPRASYGDKHTVSVMQGSNHAVFDFTSKVIDFVTITRANEDDSDDGKLGESLSTLLRSIFQPLSSLSYNLRCIARKPVFGVSDQV